MLLIQLVLIIIKYSSGNIYLRIIRPHLHGLESKLFSFAAIAIQSIKTGCYGANNVEIFPQPGGHIFLAILAEELTL
ncbi:hypothetical protein [Janthinobacterium sp. HH106]|uniref:hypothetical protein n=1 Tax=Janthinobacterium sp. HH106 TaxID=1537278 RepID=UPI001113229F|nr:hypothetical protein [Janthinobacterium sp. HH106]